MGREFVAREKAEKDLRGRSAENMFEWGIGDPSLVLGSLPV